MNTAAFKNTLKTIPKKSLQFINEDVNQALTIICQFIQKKTSEECKYEAGKVVKTGKSLHDAAS